jgi:hypothetical protein
MKPLDQLFTDIAREHLGIATLQTRHRDVLDFHEVSVWEIKRALTAAYEAGANDRPTRAKRDTAKRRE